MEDTKTLLIGEHELHEVRVQIDACTKYVEFLSDKESDNEVAKVLSKDAGRELALARIKLQEAKMWIGKALGELGSKLPLEYRDEAPKKE